MKIIIEAADPRISGSRGYVVFYDNGHQDIQVRNVYNMSDVRAKTNITNLNNSTQINIAIETQNIFIHIRATNIQIYKQRSRFSCTRS